MMKKLGWGKAGRAVDIQFLLEEPTNNGRIVKRQRWARQVDTSVTTYGTLKEVALGLFEIQGDIELWLLPANGGCPSALGSLGLNEPISKLITTKEAKLQVEKLFTHDYLIGSTTEATTTAADIGAPPSASLERNDAEIARTLSVELNRRNTKPPPVTTKKSILSWERTPKTLGTVVAQASCSQFAIAGGHSACTSICLYAAAQFLLRINETPRCISTAVLDDYLTVGTALYQNVVLHQEDDYTSVDDLWNQSAFRNVVRPLVRGPPISGTTHSFQEGLVAAMSYAQSQGERSVALVITKPPKTILLVCKNVNQRGPWFLFDSHGEDYQFPTKKASVRQLGSMDAVVAALHQKFPSLRDTRGSALQKKQINMYEAHPIVIKLNEKEQSDLETALALSNT